MKGYEDPVGVTAVFACFCHVTSHIDAAIEVTNVSTPDWNEDYKYVTFADTYESMASVTLYCNYVVDEAWGRSEGRRCEATFAFDFSKRSDMTVRSPASLFPEAIGLHQ
jgi:hypothetical protein